MTRFLLLGLLLAALPPRIEAEGEPVKHAKKVPPPRIWTEGEIIKFANTIALEATALEVEALVQKGLGKVPTTVGFLSCKGEACAEVDQEERATMLQVALSFDSEGHHVMHVTFCGGIGEWKAELIQVMKRSSGGFGTKEKMAVVYVRGNTPKLHRSCYGEK